MVNLWLPGAEDKQDNKDHLQSCLQMLSYYQPLSELNRSLGKSVWLPWGMKAKLNGLPKISDQTSKFIVLFYFYFETGVECSIFDWRRSVGGGGVFPPNLLYMPSSLQQATHALAIFLLWVKWQLGRWEKLQRKGFKILNLNRWWLPTWPHHYRWKT